MRAAEWARLRALRWDVVPVIVQDPTWEQSFPDVHGAVVPFANPANGVVAPTRFTRREVRALALEHEQPARPRRFGRSGTSAATPSWSASRTRSLRSQRGRRGGRRFGGGRHEAPRRCPAGACRSPLRRRRPTARSFFGDAFALEAADTGPFDRLPDGRLACLSDACANRVVSVGGVTVRVLPRVTPTQVAARKPAYRAPTAVAAAAGDNRADELLFGAAAMLALGAAALAAVELHGRRRLPVDRLLRALRLVRESAERAPPDRRRALDHLAATLGDAPPAEQATQLAWSRPEPEPEPTLAVADEVAR